MIINSKLIAPVIFAGASYLLAYMIPKFLVKESRLHYLGTFIDKKIPLSPVFVTIYLLAYLQWINGLIIILHQKTDFGYRLVSAIIIGSLIGKKINSHKNRR